MSIVFNRKPGVFADIEFSLFFIYNIEWFQEKMEGYGVKVHKDFFKNINQLKKWVDCNKIYMDVFFTTEIYDGMDRTLSLPCLNKSNMWEMNSYEDFINSVRESKEEDVKRAIINELLVLKERKNELEDVVNDDKKIIALIESFGCSSRIKWSVFTFLSNIEKYINEYADFLTKYIKQYDKLIGKMAREMDMFNNYIEKNIENEGLEFLKKVIDGLWEIDDYEEIYVSTMHINSISLASEYYDNKIYVLIGSNFEETIKQINGKDNIGENVSLFKGLSDKTRFNILKLLIEKEVYGQEIADAVGVSMATVNYHMTFLLTTKVVQLKKNGQKTYYSLNKERLREGIEFLEDTFKL